MVGDVDGDEIGGRVEHLLAHRELRLDLGVEVEADRDVAAQRVGGVELADLGRPLVGDLGEHLALGVLHEHLERHLVAGAFAEALGEHGVELEDVAGALAVQLGVELGHQDRRADLVEVVGGGEALDGLAVDRAGHVELGVVAVDERGLGVGEVGGALAQHVDLRVDRVVGHGRTVDRDDEGVVTLEGDFGTDFDDGVELDIAFVFTSRDVDLGRGDDVDGLGIDGFDVVLGQRVAQGLVARGLGAETRFEQTTGCLAGPEAGKLHLERELAERCVDRALEVGSRNGDVEADLVAFERLD